MKLRSLFLLCSLQPALLGFAQQRTLDQAQALAYQFSVDLSPVSGNLLSIELGRRTQSAASTRRMPSFANADRQPFYVFNNPSQGGFVIVAGDQRMGDILGYSSSSDFDLTQIPDGMADLLNFYAQVYMDARQSYSSPSTLHRAIQWQAVSPLITTKWGQSAPYNAKCPSIDGQRTLVGCGAIAMAQVMKYHRYPFRGQGSFSYTSKTNNIEQSLDFGATTFGWNAMKDSYGSGETATEVAKLVHACGVSIGMDYGKNWSNSYIVDIPYALIHYFKYAESANNYIRDFFTQEEWEQVVLDELKAKRPMVYRGANQDDNAGHIYVVDGCDRQGRLHINWGWYGNADGYFQLDNMMPSGDDYRYYHFMVKGIARESEERENIFFASQFTASIEDNSIVAQLTNVWNYSNCTTHLDDNTLFKGGLGMALYNLRGESIRVLDLYNGITLKMFWGWETFNMGCYVEDIQEPDGVYVLRPVAVSESCMSPIRTYGGATNQVYLVKENGAVRLQTNLPDGLILPKASRPTTETGIFTLDGRRLSTPLSHGVYIKNGRRVMTK